MSDARYQTREAHGNRRAQAIPRAPPFCAHVKRRSASKHPEAWLTLDDDFLDNCGGDATAFMNETICVTATRLLRRVATSRALHFDFNPCACPRLAIRPQPGRSCSHTSFLRAQASFERSLARIWECLCGRHAQTSCRSVIACVRLVCMSSLGQYSTCRGCQRFLGTGWFWPGFAT